MDFDVVVGDRCKVQNGALLYHGVTLGNGVFVGPGAIFTNDRVPRAINPDGSLKGADDWIVGKTHVHEGASIGAGAVIISGVTIGRFAMVGAGAVVTRDVDDYQLVFGNPARVHGWVTASGERVSSRSDVERANRAASHAPTPGAGGTERGSDQGPGSESRS
ncbi:MAG: N-acetyltransferase [Sandaracinaceae bacterium]|nr:N-acetyltransferase [Sandaracinaceae bacterium]